MVYCLLILMIFCNAGETIGYKNTKNENQIDILYGVTLWSFLLSIPTLIVFAIASKTSIFGNFDWVGFAFILLSAVITVASIVTWSSASKNLPMSIAEGVSEIYIAFLTFFSWLLFGGELNYLHIILIALVVIACFVLAFIQNKGDGSKKGKYNYKIGFIFLAVWVVLNIIKGLVPAVLAKDGMNGIAYNFILSSVMFLASFIILLTSKKSFKNIAKTTLSVIKDPWLFVVGLCRTASQISLIYLALKMNLGIVEAVSVFGIVLIMLYERLIMKEKISIASYIILLIIAVATAVLGIV